MTSESAPAARQLHSWIESFIEFTDGFPSPYIFRKWAAIACLAGALERKVWVRTLGSDLYPNLYVIFVAPPGIGKTVVIAEAEKFWRSLSEHFVAPTSLTKASLVDALNEARRKILRPGLVPPFVEFNSLQIVAGELGVLIPAYDNDFMNALTSIYDGHPYAERRRSKDIKFGIDKPQLNIIGATTPSYLNAFMPEGAWDQGFISRTLLIYSGERIIKSLFDESPKSTELQRALRDDLKIVGNLYGKMSFSEEAAHAISAWHMGGGHPIPEHPKLAHYLTRRTAHLLKLCMVSSVSDSSDLVITLEHYQRALDWLLEAETSMPDIFRSMNSGGDSAAIEEAWYFVWTTYGKEKKPVLEHRVVHFLRERVPSHNVMKIVEIMEKSKMIKPEITGGQKGFIPAPKKAF